MGIGEYFEELPEHTAGSTRQGQHGSLHGTAGYPWLRDGIAVYGKAEAGGARDSPLILR